MPENPAASIVGVSSCRCQFAERNAECIGDPLAVSRIGLHAVADVAKLDRSGCFADGTSRVGKKGCLLLRFHQPEEKSGSGKIIFILTMIPMVGGTFKAERWFGKIGLLAPLTLAVGFVSVATQGPFTSEQ